MATSTFQSSVNTFSGAPSTPPRACNFSDDMNSDHGMVVQQVSNSLQTSPGHAKDHVRRTPPRTGSFNFSILDTPACPWVTSSPVVGCNRSREDDVCENDETSERGDPAVYLRHTRTNPTDALGETPLMRATSAPEEPISPPRTNLLSRTQACEPPASVVHEQQAAERTQFGTAPLTPFVNRTSASGPHAQWRYSPGMSRHVLSPSDMKPTTAWLLQQSAVPSTELFLPQCTGKGDNSLMEEQAQLDDDPALELYSPGNHILTLLTDSSCTSGKTTEEKRRMIASNIRAKRLQSDRRVNRRSTSNERRSRNRALFDRSSRNSSTGRSKAKSETTERADVHHSRLREDYSTSQTKHRATNYKFGSVSLHNTVRNYNDQGHSFSRASSETLSARNHDSFEAAEMLMALSPPREKQPAEHYLDSIRSDRSSMSVKQFSMRSATTSVTHPLVFGDNTSDEHQDNDAMVALAMLERAQSQQQELRDSSIFSAMRRTNQRLTEKTSSETSKGSHLRDPSPSSRSALHKSKLVPLHGALPTVCDQVKHTRDRLSSGGSLHEMDTNRVPGASPGISLSNQFRLTSSDAISSSRSTNRVRRASIESNPNTDLTMTARKYSNTAGDPKSLHDCVSAVTDCLDALRSAVRPAGDFRSPSAPEEDNEKHHRIHDHGPTRHRDISCPPNIQRHRHRSSSDDNMDTEHMYQTTTTTTTTTTTATATRRSSKGLEMKSGSSVLYSRPLFASPNTDHSDHKPQQHSLRSSNLDSKYRLSGTHAPRKRSLVTSTSKSDAHESHSRDLNGLLPKEYHDVFDSDHSDHDQSSLRYDTNLEMTQSSQHESDTETARQSRNRRNSGTNRYVSTTNQKRTVQTNRSASRSGTGSSTNNNRTQESASPDKKEESTRRVSPYLGVSWIKASQRWRADSVIDGKLQYLGCFHTEHEAAHAVDAARVNAWDRQKRLRLNFPDQYPQVPDKMKSHAVKTSDVDGSKKSDYIGVAWDFKRRKWRARIAQLSDESQGIHSMYASPPGRTSFSRHSNQRFPAASTLSCTSGAFSVEYFTSELEAARAVDASKFVIYQKTLELAADDEQRNRVPKPRLNFPNEYGIRSTPRSRRASRNSSTPLATVRKGARTSPSTKSVQMSRNDVESNELSGRKAGRNRRRVSKRARSSSITSSEISEQSNLMTEYSTPNRYIADTNQITYDTSDTTMLYDHSTRHYNTIHNSPLST